MEEKEYIEQRLDDQIQWYDNKSGRSQKWYKRLRIVEIICAASIPFLFGLAELVGNAWFWADIFRGLAALVGVFVAISSGILGLYKFQDNWMAYRTTCEMLRHEKYFYQTRCGPYKNAKVPFSTLVSRVENLISQENTNWRAYMKSEDDTQEAGQ